MNCLLRDRKRLRDPCHIQLSRAQEGSLVSKSFVVSKADIRLWATSLSYGLVICIKKIKKKIGYMWKRIVIILLLQVWKRFTKNIYRLQETYGSYAEDMTEQSPCALPSVLETLFIFRALRWRFFYTIITACLLIHILQVKI